MSLIDILIVMLIFLMVTTSFKQNPAVKLVLPESRQARRGATEANLIVTIAKQPPFLYLGAQSISPDKLQSEVLARVARNPDTSLSIVVALVTAASLFTSPIAPRIAGTSEAAFTPRATSQRLSSGIRKLEK